MKNLITCLIVCVMSGVTFATTWTVDDDGKADFNNIQAAFDAADLNGGDEIVVMPGIYTSDIDTVNEVVQMRFKSVTLRSSDPNDPDVVAATIIDGGFDMRGIVVLGDKGGTDNTVIEGFTIRYGNGGDFGGAIWIYYSNATINNCIFTNNTAVDGGGVACEESSTTLSNCSFISNEAADEGGGMYNVNSNPTLTDCTFTGNTAEYGGGMWNDYSNPTLTGCTFKNNSADRGGGMYNDISSPTLDGCTFTGNIASSTGGGMYNSEGSPMLTNCTLCSNTPNQIFGPWSDEGGNTVAAICAITGTCCTNDNCLVSEQENCLAFFGEWQGEGTTCEDNPCPTSCLGDVTGDGQVNVSDLLVVISVWGACP